MKGSETPPPKHRVDLEIKEQMAPLFGCLLRPGNTLYQKGGRGTVSGRFEKFSHADPTERGP